MSSWQTRDASAGARRLPAAAAAGGFTLLEVLVAMVILGVAVVATIQVASQSLRLLKLSGEHQQAVELADQIARSTEPNEAGIESGEAGLFRWERRVALVSLPEDLDPPRRLPGAPSPRLFSVSVAVSWGTRSVEVATLRSSLGTAPEGQTP